MKHIVAFMGGFANQLFQYCLYEMLREKFPNDDVKADISFYKTNNDHGGFKLDRFFDIKY